MVLHGGRFSEKRSFVRMGLDCDVNYRLLPDGPAGVAKGRNLSCSGICIELPKSLVIGQQLGIQIEPSKAIVPALNATAEVVRVIQNGDGGFQIGAAITQISS